jgi:hypothetical protein
VQTHDTPSFTVPSFFWFRLPRPSRKVTGRRVPMFERPTVNEDEPPYRVGRGVVIRLWPASSGLVLGVWGASQQGEQESESLANALGGVVLSMVPITEMAEWRRPWLDEEEDDFDVTIEDFRDGSA